MAKMDKGVLTGKPVTYPIPCPAGAMSLTFQTQFLLRKSRRVFSFDKGTFVTSLASCRMVGRSPCTERYGCSAPLMYAAQRKTGTGWRSTRCCSAICARRLFTASWLNSESQKVPERRERANRER